MAAKIIGNHGSYLMHGLSGVGTENVADPSIGWVAVSGRAGDYIVLSAADIHGVITSAGVQRGYFFQGDGSATGTVKFTLANAGWAKSTDPAIQAQVAWADPPTAPTALTSPAISITGDTIFWYAGAFSALKVTFTAPGIVFIVAR